MATAPQTAMQMPEQGANPFADPNTMAVYDQMRQTVSPKEFGDEMLAGAAQTAPEDVAAFRSALEQIDLPPEALDLLNNMVDEILANPDKYEEIRAKYSEMGAPDEILPEQFDAEFFSALNMAVDQMIAEPAGVQAFAKGGIAELKPIAKAIASYGRNGDTMLAHITPAEARMLRRKGGSGTINPNTGLPEYFSLKKLFKTIVSPLKAIGKAVKSFAKSTVGRIVTTVALGFFLGPAVASAMGIGAGTAAAAAVGGFVGGAGSTLLAGGNLKDALKAGAIGGFTMGAIEGFSGAPLTGGPAAPGSFSDIVGGQVDVARNKLSGMFGGASGPQAPAIDASGGVKGLAPTDVTQAPYKPLEMTGTPSKPFSDYFGTQPPVAAPAVNPMDATEFQGSLAKPQGVAPPTDPSFMDKAKDFYDKKLFPSDIQAQAEPAAREAGIAAQKAMLARTPTATPAMLDAEFLRASKAAMPGILSTYGPMAAAGLGAIGLAGGFTPTNATPSTLKPELMKPVTQRIAEGGNQKAYYMQGLPGVKYDQYGAPIFGQNVPLPTFDTGLGIQSLINPKAFAAGGAVTAANFDETAYLNANQDVKDAIARGEFKNAYEHYTKFGQAENRTAFDKTVTAAQAAADAAAKEAAQAANRKLVADATAARKAAGFGNAYQNINAGLSYDVPAGIAATSIAARQAAFKPTMDKFTQAQATNAATLAKPYTPTVVDAAGMTAAQKAAADAAAAKAAADKLAADKAAVGTSANDQLIRNAYASIGRSGIGTDASNIDQEGYNYWMNDLQTGVVAPDAFNARFNATKENYMSQNPNDKYTNYVNKYVTAQKAAADAAAAAPVEKKLMNMGGIASLRSGGYPRRTGQINGPGTATSDSIPAMLSDGEFVMTAKAVRGAGKGDRRAGAKRMYALMNQLEKNAARG